MSTFKIGSLVVALSSVQGLRAGNQYEVVGEREDRSGRTMRTLFGVKPVAADSGPMWIANGHLLFREIPNTKDHMNRDAQYKKSRGSTGPFNLEADDSNVDPLVAALNAISEHLAAMPAGAVKS